MGKEISVSFAFLDKNPNIKQTIARADPSAGLVIRDKGISFIQK